MATLCSPEGVHPATCREQHAQNSMPCSHLTVHCKAPQVAASTGSLPFARHNLALTQGAEASPVIQSRPAAEADSGYPCSQTGLTAGLVHRQYNVPHDVLHVAPIPDRWAAMCRRLCSTLYCLSTSSTISVLHAAPSLTGWAARCRRSQVVAAYPVPGRPCTCVWLQSLTGSTAGCRVWAWQPGTGWLRAAMKAALRLMRGKAASAVVMPVGLSSAGRGRWRSWSSQGMAG